MEQESLQFELSVERATVVSAAASVLAPVPVREPHIYTVSELTSQVKGLLEEHLVDIWVGGEVSNFRPHASGHWFFRLKDEESVIEAVVFRQIAQKFPFAVENGMALICHGRLNVYAPHGKYSFVIDSAEPKGIGALQIAFEQLKLRLAAEGLFTAAHKHPVPLFPRCVGIVTAPTGAVIHDMIRVMQRRFPAVEIVLAPAKVQGEGAAESIAAALQTLDTGGTCDVIIVGRGGGSVEDLWAFNEERVVRAIFACRTPVVSAVGHEIDFTMADFVADLRAPTPSAAAEMVVPDQQQVRSQVAELRHRLAMGLRRWWELRGQQLRALQVRLRPPTARFPDLYLRIAGCRDRLAQSMHARLRDQQGALGHLAGALQHLSPLAVLAKGYAVVTDAVTGAVVRGAADVALGATIEVRLAAGALRAEVKERR